jgi:hypothetical protein
MLRYFLTCEILTVFIFGVLLVKSANSSKIKPNIGAIQHITCRLIRFHLYLLIQFEFVCTTYIFLWWSCFVSSILPFNSHTTIFLSMLTLLRYTQPQSTVHHHQFVVYGDAQWYNTFIIVFFQRPSVHHFVTLIALL